MSSHIDRLKASKENHEREQDQTGEEAGYLWARNESTYVELIFFAKLDADSFANYDNGMEIDRAIFDAAGAEDSGVNQYEIGMITKPNSGMQRSKEFLIGFLRGVQRLHSEVEHEL